MNKTEWNQLMHQDFCKFKAEYIAFMNDEENIENCDECPENRDFTNNVRYVCGQQNCWVRCHCDI